jgi:NAD(P)-dependent dehydrogenase (short-subunit alcohol dehydrogenase family)
MKPLCEGRTVIVTGAGRGIGREHALAFARHGARVLVNDLGTSVAGAGRSSETAENVMREIRELGGEAVSNADDVANFAAAGRLVEQALDVFGSLDVVVNNAGFLQDRMFASATEEEWDAVMRVHLKGHFCVSRHASAHFRSRTKAGKPVDGRIINTSSGAGLLGAVGQSAYSAAKAGIAALTLVQAVELGRYGVTVNAIAPAARTRMTEVVFREMMAPPDGGFDVMHPANISPLVVWLGSSESKAVTGRVFELRGGQICLYVGWRPGPQVDAQARWQPEDLGPTIHDLLNRATPAIAPYGA